ncbi:unnamed protein product [Orchesella dallaii]|uniref:Uncharacterized protein n=1 Tax=Orchesella dallaii TaxID=48710 RepID=A0ABP1SB56_9HEXA
MPLLSTKAFSAAKAAFTIVPTAEAGEGLKSPIETHHTLLDAAAGGGADPFQKPGEPAKVKRLLQAAVRLQFDNNPHVEKLAFSTQTYLFHRRSKRRAKIHDAAAGGGGDPFQKPGEPAKVKRLHQADVNLREHLPRWARGRPMLRKRERVLEEKSGR